MKPLLYALVPVQSVFENLTSWKVLINVLRFCIDTAIFILICFQLLLQTVSLPICALLCQRTDFPIKHFSADGCC